MEKYFEEYMQPGEKLLWCGKPEPFEVFDDEYKKKISSTILFWSVLAIFCEIGYISFVLGAKLKINIIPMMLIAAFCALALFARLREPAQVKDMEYALTDRSIMVKGKNLKICPYSDVKYAWVHTDKVGTKSLICGAQTDALHNENFDARLLTVLGNAKGLKGRYLADSIAMYSIPEDAVEIIKGRLSLKKF
jgi:hypothetical protein